MSKNNNSLFQNEIIKWELTMFTSQSKIDNIIMCMSQKYILGEGKLVMVLAQLTLWNSLRMPGLPRVFCPISLKRDMDIGKILFTLS